MMPHDIDCDQGSDEVEVVRSCDGMPGKGRWYARQQQGSRMARLYRNKRKRQQMRLELLAALEEFDNRFDSASDLLCFWRVSY